MASPFRPAQLQGTCQPPRSVRASIDAAAFARLGALPSDDHGRGRRVDGPTACRSIDTCPPSGSEAIGDAERAPFHPDRIGRAVGGEARGILAGERDKLAEVRAQAPARVQPDLAPAPKLSANMVCDLSSCGR